MSKATEYLASKGLLNEAKTGTLKVGDKVKLINANDAMEYHRKAPNDGMTKGKEKMWMKKLEEYAPHFKKFEGKVGEVTTALTPNKDYTGTIVNMVYVKYPDSNVNEMFSSAILEKVKE